MNVTLKGKKHEAGDVFSFYLAPEEPVQWTPGQYAKYLMPLEQPDEKGGKRYFTIASAPFEGHMQISTRVTDSAFKQKLSRLTEGDGFEMASVGGDFVVEDPSRQMVFIAGGIGITPFRSILLDLDHRQHPINVNLLYANRNQEIPFLEELRSLDSRHESMSLHLLVEPDRLNAESIRSLVPDMNSPIFFVSGPEPMVAAIAGTLKEMGVDEPRIKLDDFPGYETI